MSYIGSQPATNFETVRKQVSTTNSGTTITLDFAVSSVQDILVTVNAVVQSYDNYSVSGTTLTLGGTLNNDRVEILYVGRTFQTVSPAVGTVTNDMLSGSIANSKLANSSITLNGSAVSLGGSATVGGDNKPYFKVALSSTQNNVGTGQTKITFNHRLIDPDSVFDTTNHRFLPTTAGKYFFHTNARLYSSDTNSSMSLYLFKNGSEIDRLTEQRHTGQSYSVLVGSSIQEANGSSDYFEIYAKINQNTADITADPSNYTWSYFEGFKLIT